MGRNTAHTTTHTTHTTTAISRLAAVGFTAVLALSACGSNDDSTDATADSANFDAPAEEVAADASATSEGDELFSSDDTTRAGANQQATAGSDSTGAPIDFTFGRDLIIDASVTMVTPDIGRAADDVIDIARRNGGAVFNANVTVDDPLDDGSVPGGGQIVVRLPPTSLDLLVTDLKGVGTIRNQSQSVDDVTDRLIDLDIQIRQALESVERMEALLSETTEFDALVAAEIQLSQRQIAYERLLAAKRNVDDRVALSTLTVNLEYQAPNTEPIALDPADPGLADAFSDGWSAFVGVLFGLAFIVAITAPFLAIAITLTGIGWLATRRIRRARSESINHDEPLTDSPVEQPLVDANT
jgi:hypothetical protein